MLQLSSLKLSFLLCLGLSFGTLLFFCFRPAGRRDSVLPRAETLGFFPAECRAFLNGSEAGKDEWLQRDCCPVEKYVQNKTLQCSDLIRKLHFIERPLSREEEEFPLAFIITIHKELDVFVRLLRAVYMPQNVYCVHVDAKAPQEYRATVERLVGCFPNAFLSSRSELVTYGGFSRLRADVNCMEDLLRSGSGWRVVLNLCGQDFPVMSNLELVRYLQRKEWLGKNMTPGVRQPPQFRHRTRFQHEEVAGKYVARRVPNALKGPPPHNLRIYFGTAYYALTRAFVEFLQSSPVALDLLSWSRDTFSPDEHFWTTLNHYGGAPGSRIHGGWEGDVRAVKWRDQEGKAHVSCKGRYVRDICVYGLGDLPWIVNKNSMFANKFEGASDPAALRCLERWHRRKALGQAQVPAESSWLLDGTNVSDGHANGTGANT